MCATCDGLGKLILPKPRRPFASRRLSNLAIGISLLALALLISWWVIR
jgi:hypothetical protein